MDTFQIQSKIAELEVKIDLYTKYMWEKIQEKDYHGICDASMDIREFVAKIEVYKELMGGKGE